MQEGGHGRAVHGEQDRVHPAVVGAGQGGGGAGPHQLQPAGRRAAPLHTDSRQHRRHHQQGARAR